MKKSKRKVLQAVLRIDKGEERLRQVLKGTGGGPVEVKVKVDIAVCSKGISRG